jgi:hypothetical protein
MSDEEIPEADPKSDIDPDEKLEVNGGTLVWEDPVSSGNSIPGAYVWPMAIIGLIVLGIVLVLT